MNAKRLRSSGLQYFEQENSHINAMFVGGGGMMSIVNKQQSSSHPSKLQKQHLAGSTQEAPPGNQHQNVHNLFGIRKPLGILTDADYKHRLQLEEMVSCQSLNLGEEPSGSRSASARHFSGLDADERSLELEGLASPYRFPEEDARNTPNQRTEKTAATAQRYRLLGREPATFTKTDYSVKIFYPKKFEAMRKFYCGSQSNFLESMINSAAWVDNNGGKTRSHFQTTFDKKFVLKEVKRSELRMFLEFAP